jgi:hypothetical protein
MEELKMYNIENLIRANSWNQILDHVMLQDTSAPASILSYYLDDVKDNGTIFCPLGYELYKVIGHAIREEPDAFAAAIDTGLMASAIRTYVNAALDVWENWDLMKNGVLRLMSDPRLICFISCHNRTYIQYLKDIDDEDEWYAAYDRLNGALCGTFPKGYCA